MPPISILLNSFNPRIYKHPSVCDGSKVFVLKETGIQAKLKHKKIRGIPNDSLLLKIDDGDIPTFFEETNGARKRCDYLLIATTPTPRLIFIELKSVQIKKAHVIQQLKGAECLVDYFNSILDRFYGNSSYFDKFEKHFVCFHYSTLNKTPSPITHNKTTPQNNNSPENMRKIPSSNKSSSHFKTLI